MPLHRGDDSISLRVRLAQFQYIGIVAVAPLWLIFASEYARWRWLRDKAAQWILTVWFPLDAASAARRHA